MATVVGFPSQMYKEPDAFLGSKVKEDTVLIAHSCILTSTHHTILKAGPVKKDDFFNFMSLFPFVYGSSEGHFHLYLILDQFRLLKYKVQTLWSPQNAHE